MDLDVGFHRVNGPRLAAASIHLLFLDARTVTDGKHMEAIREGTEDYEYLRMLRDRVRVEILTTLLALEGLRPLRQLPQPVVARGGEAGGLGAVVEE